VVKQEIPEPPKEIVLQPKAAPVKEVIPAKELEKVLPQAPAKQVFKEKSDIETESAVKIIREPSRETGEVISIQLHRQIVNLFFFMHIASLVAILVLIVLKA
jgi:lipopolysaccharide export system protein LptC